MSIGRFSSSSGMVLDADGCFVTYKDYAELSDRVRLLEHCLNERDAALQAMTIDRNLWQDAHNEDCPNKAMIETLETSNKELLEALRFRFKHDNECQYKAWHTVDLCPDCKDNAKNHEQLIQRAEKVTV